MNADLVDELATCVYTTGITRNGEAACAKKLVNDAVTQNAVKFLSSIPLGGAKEYPAWALIAAHVAIPAEAPARFEGEFYVQRNVKSGKIRIAVLFPNSPRDRLNVKEAVNALLKSDNFTDALAMIRDTRILPRLVRLDARLAALKQELAELTVERARALADL